MMLVKNATSLLNTTIAPMRAKMSVDDSLPMIHASTMNDSNNTNEYRLHINYYFAVMVSVRNGAGGRTTTVDDGAAERHRTTAGRCTHCRRIRVECRPCAAYSLPFHRPPRISLLLLLCAAQCCIHDDNDNFITIYFYVTV